MNSIIRARTQRLYERHQWFRDRDSIDTMAEYTAGAQDARGYSGWIQDWFASMPSCPHADSLEYTRSDHTGMPPLKKITDHWQSRPEAAGALFGPELEWILKDRRRGPRLVCFGCLLPPPGCSSYDPVRPGDYERAHLQDSCLGGENEVGNLIPLCSADHWRMTCNFSGCRACGARWIRWLNKADLSEEMRTRTSPGRDQ